jgi:hypothetical protein
MNIIKYLNNKISFYKILMLFWGLFWLLNGLDKFYNGDFIPNPNSYATSSIIYNMDGKEVYKIQPVEPYGWFGVNRDSKMVGYFKRLNLPKWMALTALYTMGFIETALGLSLLLVLTFGNIHSDWNRLNMKMIIVIFFLFSIFDILFGDRMELWEHGTFLTLATIHYIYFLFAIPGERFDTIRDSLYKKAKEL